ncbi:MAG: rhodanese-related sulfurtransferase [Candidatus Omnitrophota bacterium]|jgi:rhodanese-related sulfurtransferase
MKKIMLFLFIVLPIITLNSMAFADQDPNDTRTAKGKVSPLEVEGAATITAQEAKALFDRAVIFIDVRKDSDWDNSRIPEATHIELKKAFTEESLGKVIAHGDEVVFYCNGIKCLRSSIASEKAVGWGYEKVYYFRKGLPAWQKEGYPVE